MIEAEDDAREAIQNDTDVATLFVHLCSGEIVEMHGVTGHRVSDNNVVIEHIDGEVSVIARRDVYFISDGQISPPPLQ